MASSLNQPLSEPEVSGGSSLGMSWRPVNSPGPETVISTPKALPALEPPKEANGFLADLTSRLFAPNYSSENVAGIEIGHFRILRRIGVGGMGSVFLAQDERLKRDVALKVLAPALSVDSTCIQRFQNEAQAAARLDHDNIARVFYQGDEYGLHYIAYEFVPGRNLRDVIQAKGRVEISEAVNYTIQLTAALHHLSNAGVIHRDIKPSNVLVTSQGRVKLVDLGLARKMSLESSAELTVPGTTMGTFDYISPEQARDPHSVDVRSDIYSLGCTLYHMLTGEPPYPEGTVLQKLLDHQAKDAPDPARKNKFVSPMLSHIVRKMMASQPDDRYADPGDLLRDLLHIARTLGPGAVPVDGQVWLTATRFKPPFWQNNFGWVAVTCLLCLLVCGVQVYQGFNQKLPLPEVRTAKFEPIIIDDGIEAIKKDIERSEREPATTAKTPNNPFPSVLEDSILLGKNRTNGLALPDKPSDLDPTPADEPHVNPKPKNDKPPFVNDDTNWPIRVVNGNSYETLEAACAEASDIAGNSIIELHYNGPRKPEHRIRLSNKKVIIRAGAGYRPTILFAPTIPMVEEERHMITVAGGSLEIVNVNVTMALTSVSNRAASDRWAMFSLERADKIQLKGVNLTVDNPHDRPACVFEQRSFIGQNRNESSPAVPPELRLTESVVRGNADLIVMRDPSSARFELKDSAVGIDGNLLQFKLVMDTEGMDHESINVELEHLTFRFGQSLLAVEGTGGPNEKLPQIRVDAGNCVFSLEPNRPLITMRGIADFMDLQKSFLWKGNFNFYDNTRSFLDITTVQGTGGPPRMDYASWKSFADDGGGSSNLPVTWRGKLPENGYSSLTAEHFTLASDSQPAIRGASDGNAAGVPRSVVEKTASDE